MAETEHTCAERRPLPHLPDKFQVAARDDAMAPRVPVGTRVEFDQTLTPRDGDGVLVRVGSGETYFRLYRDTFDGCFEAVPLNPEFRRSYFDSQFEPALQVVAVLTGVCARWAPQAGSNALTDPESLRVAVGAWQRAAGDAEAAGAAFSLFDCYAHLGSLRGLQ